MWQPYQILWPLLSLFLVRVDLTDLWRLEIPVKLLKVYDGDTVLVRYGRTEVKVRLEKLDAPEKGQPFFKGEGDAGMLARSCLLKLIEKESQFILIPKGRDIYGRTLGDVSGLSFKAVKAGCAGLYPHAVFASKKEKYRYLYALQEAQRLQKGIWKYSGFMQPKKWRKLSKRSAHRR